MKQNLHIAKFRFSRRKFYESLIRMSGTPDRSLSAPVVVSMRPLGSPYQASAAVQGSAPSARAAERRALPYRGSRSCCSRDAQGAGVAVRRAPPHRGASR